MEITLKQADIEKAIARHVQAIGISRDVVNVTFITSRKGGFSISAEVEVSDEASAPVGAMKRTAGEACSRPAVKEVAETPEVTEEPTAEPEAEPAAEEEPVAEKEPEPAKTEPPFEPDTVAGNDDEAGEPEVATKPAGKSLFS